MRFASTGASDGVLLFMGTTGDLWITPDTTGSVNHGVAVADTKTTSWRGIGLASAFPSGLSTGPYIFIVNPAGTSAGLYYNSILYSALVSNGANYVYVAGTSSGSALAPGISAFGVDDDIDVNVQPKGTGLARLNYTAVALGGGAAATLGTIGGSGPGTAGQAYWLPVRIGGSTGRFFLALWST